MKRSTHVAGGHFKRLHTYLCESYIGKPINLVMSILQVVGISVGSSVAALVRMWLGLTPFPHCSVEIHIADYTV